MKEASKENGFFYESLSLETCFFWTFYSNKYSRINMNQGQEGRTLLCFLQLKRRRRLVKTTWHGSSFLAQADLGTVHVGAG